MARRIAPTYDDSQALAQLERIWDQMGRGVVRDPRFFEWRVSDQTNSRAALNEALAICDESREVRRRLERLGVRERIAAYADWCQALGDPYARRARLFAERAGVR